MFLYWLTKFFFGAFAKVFFRLKVEGLENFPQEGGFILAANHASSLDPFIIIASMPRYIRWLVIYEYFDLWFLRWLLTRMRFIRVENTLPKETFRTLKQGGIIGLFPEGRRSWSGKLGPGRAGVAVLARGASSPVVPVAILGSYEALPRTRKWIKFCPITVRIGRPLFFTDSGNREVDNQSSDQEHTQKIMHAIAELLQR